MTSFEIHFQSAFECHGIGLPRGDLYELRDRTTYCKVSFEWVSGQISVSTLPIGLALLCS